MNWPILWVLCLAIFTSTLGQGLVVPLLPVYADSLGASGFFIGLIFGMFSISRSVFLPYFGYLSDLKGRKPFITWGLFFYFCASLAFILSHDVTSLIVIRFLQGISSAMILPVAQAYAAEISPRGKEGKMMGIVNIASFSGLSAGPMFGGVIKDTFGMKASFASMGLVCIFGCLLCVFRLPSKQSEQIVIKRVIPLPAKLLITNINVIGVLLVRFGYILCVGALWAFLPLIAETDYDLSSSAIGIIMSLVVFTSALLSVPIGVLSDRTSKRFLMLIGGALTLFGILLLYRSSRSWELYLIAGFVGVGGGFLTPATTAMSAVIGKKLHSVGSVMSILTMGQSMGMVVGPLLAGLIIDYSDSKSAFLVGGIVFFGLLIVSFGLTCNYQAMEKAACSID